MEIEPSKGHAINGLPIPPLLFDLIASGQWRHPGGNVLRKIIPFIEEIDFLSDVERIKKESASLQKSRMSAPHDTNPGRSALPFLDCGRALLIAVNREHGDDVAIALDYRTSMTDPRVVAGAMGPDQRWIWHEVAPSFSQFASLINATVAKEEDDAEKANSAVRSRTTSSQQSIFVMAFGVGNYLLDCHLQHARHPDASWIASGMYSSLGLLFDVVVLAIGIYCLATAQE